MKSCIIVTLWKKKKHSREIGECSFISSILDPSHWSKVSRKSSFKLPTRQEQSPFILRTFSSNLFHFLSPVLLLLVSESSHHFHQRTEGWNIKRNPNLFQFYSLSKLFHARELYLKFSVSMNYISISRNFPFVWVTLLVKWKKLFHLSHPLLSSQPCSP